MERTWSEDIVETRNETITVHKNGGQGAKAASLYYSARGHLKQQRAIMRDAISTIMEYYAGEIVFLLVIIEFYSEPDIFVALQMTRRGL